MYAYAAVALISGALAFAGAWETQNWRYEAKESARLEQLALDTAAAQVPVAEATKTLVEVREKIRIKNVVITETVEKLVDRPVYINTCIDEDGVKAINDGMLP